MQATPGVAAMGATFIGVALLSATIFLPWLQPVFDTVALGPKEVFLTIELALLPSLWAEVSKKLFPTRQGTARG